ncbi:MAG: glycosyltransferase family 9 protein [Alphaproteobacteria bacterium]|nr:glycosyltransferase family 9 protein [Alphaproteobacteria bacterium]
MAASPAATQQSRTTLVAFTAASAFSFRFPNASAAANQQGTTGQTYLTNVAAFANQALVPNPNQFRITATDARIACLPRAEWASRDFKGRTVGFLLGTHALGDNVQVLLFLQAFIDRHRPAAVTIFCTGPAHDIYLTNPAITAYPLWIERDRIAAFDVVIDLGALEAGHDIDVWPIDFEASLLKAFALSPSAHYPGGARALAPKGDATIGIFPLASSPLRTLPSAAAIGLAEALTPRGQVSLCLNRNQRQGVLYRHALGPIARSGVRVVEAFESVGALIGAIEAFDYVVVADSGPAHLAKLFRVPGVAVYTSAPGEVLQGRFTNLARWSVPFEGRHCRAPCGLAKLRATADGRIGCMGSLETTLARLPSLPRAPDAKAVERLMAEPVPCVAHLAADPKPLVDFVLADLADRCVQ